MNDKADFTQGSILKKLIAFMMPVLGALILQAAYGAVDLLVVGRFGSTSGLSAVSTGSQVLNLVTFVVIQFAMGITVLIARYLGEKRPDQIGSVIGGSAVVFTMIAACLFIVMVGFAHPISVLMQAPKEAVDLTSVYVRICGGGIFFIVAYNLLSAIFRGLGDSKSPLLFVFVACIVNVIGDLVLVAGLHMDAAGAAIATVTAQALSVVFAVILLIKKKLPFKITRKDFSLNSQCKKFLKIGAAACTAGVFDTDVLPGTLCIRKPAWSGSFFRLRCCMQDRQLCDAGTKCADAVDGIFRIPEHRSRKDETCEEIHVHRNRCRPGCGMHGILTGDVKRRYARRILYDRCSRYPERLCISERICTGDNRDSDPVQYGRILQW